MSAVAEKVAMLWTKSRVPRTIECDAVSIRMQKSFWLQNAELQSIWKAYFDESVSIRDFHDEIRAANAKTVTAALHCARSCVLRAFKQAKAMEGTLEVGTMSAGNSGGIQSIQVKFVIEEKSVIESSIPSWNPRSGTS